MTEKPKIDALETEQLLKGMGYFASVVIHDNGLVTAKAISGVSVNDRVQAEVDAALENIQKKYRIEKRRPIFKQPNR